MKKHYLAIFIVFTGFLISCKRDSNDVAGVWNSDPVEVISVTPINGGATVSYKVPPGDDLLYVMAEYIRNGKPFTEKASVYNNELTIEGFDTTGTIKAMVYKVNKQGQRSQPTEIEFAPLESLVSITNRSLKFVPGFGGIIASWENPKATELGVRLMVKDQYDKYETNSMYFTAEPLEVHAFRGFEPKPTDFAVSFEDKWGNISDTVYYSTTPFFETMIPKPYADYRTNIPFDNPTNYNSTKPFTSLWDNVVNTSGHGWLTVSGNSGLSITFDMKQVVKLSRIVIHGYHVNSPYDQANIQQFEVWGTDKIDFARLSDRPYWLDSLSVAWGALTKAGIPTTTMLPERTFKDDWQYLGWHSILPRLTETEAVMNLAASGAEYTMPIDARPVRYIRLFVRQNSNSMPPPGTNYFSMGEISFYGDNTVPQQ